jgi:putative ABC transport system substrate-binding protein
MKRREFITLIGGMAVAWPLAARAQQRGKPARIGYLSSSSPPDNNFQSFLAGMRALGYSEGGDFVIEIAMPGAITAASPRSPMTCSGRESM